MQAYANTEESSYEMYIFISAVTICCILPLGFISLSLKNCIPIVCIVKKSYLPSERN